ncbi:hypothetical protein [Pseudomonas aeruginosa]|uniref:hypothetical protein n=1 Tax=Pseudomonas aeruginosa TaxID=287 RepID=UPI0032B507BA|nr:hypothetical protein [Pseudomonas aeruginosa]HCH7782534.1 hypothetical protein [Pseudomonas aeruginosa]
MTTPTPSFSEEFVTERLEASYAQLRKLMVENEDDLRRKFHGMAQGILIAMHSLGLLDDAAFDARTADLSSEL